MTSDTLSPATPKGDNDTSRGRPRDEARTVAILEATHDLVRELGYDTLRVQDVAARAGCGLATIYRRWSTKEELVAAAIKNRPFPTVLETGDPEVDLHRFVYVLAVDIGEHGEFIAGFIKATRSHPVLGETVRTHVIDVARHRLHGYIAEIAGTRHPNIGFIVDSVTGVLLLRAGLLGESVDPNGLADEVCNLVRSVKK